LFKVEHADEIVNRKSQIVNGNRRARRESNAGPSA
jgi:hypothetical protein